MELDFWFDPSCPFTWVTSRWIVDVADDRDLTVNWRTFSLLLKNGDDMAAPHRVPAEHTLGALRVVEALISEGKAAQVGDLYTEMGERFHRDGDTSFSIAGCLVAVGLDAAYASAADDDSFDAQISASMDEGLGYGGDDVGVPIIRVQGSDGLSTGFFGPVLSEVPDHEVGLRVFDLSRELAGIDAFSELKQRRRELTVPGRS